MVVRFLISLVLSITAIDSRPSAVGAQSTAQNRPTGCEYNTSILDGLAQKTKPDELIIVIAHLGTRDTKPNLNDRRLHNVRTYLTEFLTEPSVRRKPATVILAQGERVQGFGRIDFYVHGQLAESLRIRVNADLSVANCAREPHESPCPASMRNFFPCKDKYPGR